MATGTDICNAALAWLGVIEVGETPASDEMTLATNTLNDLVSEWTIRRIITINLTGVNPEQVEPAGKLLGNRIGPKFGRPYDPDVDSREEQRLRDLQTQFSRRRGVGAVAL